MSIGNESSSQLPSRNMIMGIVGAVVLAITLLVGFTTWQGVISDGSAKEGRLTSVYNGAAIAFATCKQNAVTAVGSINAQQEAVNNILNKAVDGGYGDAKQLKNNGLANNGLYLALKAVNPWPNTDQLQKGFDRVRDIIVGCTNDFRDQQNLVQTHVANFKVWMSSFKVRTFGGRFPSDKLRINLNGHITTGQTAFDQMEGPIVDNATINAFNTGKVEPVNPFATNEPTTPSTPPSATPTPTRTK